MATKKPSTKQNGASSSGDSLKLLIADPIDDLKDEFIARTTALEKTLDTAIKSQNRITMFVIVVMAVAVLILLFAFASVLVVSWQSNQTIHDAVQLQLNSAKSE